MVLAAVVVTAAGGGGRGEGQPMGPRSREATTGQLVTSRSGLQSSLMGVCDPRSARPAESRIRSDREVRSFLDSSSHVLT